MNLYKIIHSLFLVLLLITSCKDKQTSNTDSRLRSNKDTMSEIKSQPQVETVTGSSHGLRNIQFNISELPEDLKYNGTIKRSASWLDNSGINFIVLTETEEKNQKGEFLMKELFAYHWLYNDNKPSLLWRI